MSLYCQTCKKELEQLDGIFVCPEGHVSHYTQEVMEEDQKNISERHHKVRLKNTEPTYKKVYKFFTIMYFKMKNFFNIKSDLCFKIMLSYHKDTTIDIFSFYCLYSILYYSLRAQKEKEYEILMLNEFEFMFPRSYYMYNFNKYINEYNLVNNTDIFHRFMLDNILSSVYLLEWLKLFGNVCYKTKGSSFFVPSDECKNNIEIKRIYRSMVRRDEKIMNMYLKTTTSDLGIQLTDDIKYQFKRLCDFYLDDKRVFIPDFLVCLFLYLYASTYDLEIDRSKVENTLCHKEDIYELFKREIKEQIHNCNYKGDLSQFRKYQKEYKIVKTYKPLRDCENNMDFFKYIFCVYIHSTEDAFLWFVNNLALFMDYACENKLQLHLEKEMKSNLCMLNLIKTTYIKEKEDVKARRKERNIKQEIKKNEMKAVRAIQKEEKRKKSKAYINKMNNL